MILAIDPGNIESAYVLTKDNLEVIEKGKVENISLLKDVRLMIELIPPTLQDDEKFNVAIEMVACYGMAVGKEVFETCVMIGQLKEICRQDGIEPTYIYRKDEKITICNSMKAKDSNIRQALIDRFAVHDFKNGKGTKSNPDTFYGFKADIWASMAVAVTYHDMYLKGDNVNEEEAHQKEL